MTATSVPRPPAPALSMVSRVQAMPGLWAVGQLMVNADRLLTEAARTNAAAALRAEQTRRAIWLAEADDWRRAEGIRLP